MINSWVEFHAVETKKKTKVYNIISRSDSSILGQIRWHAPYRKYALFVTSKVTPSSEMLPYVIYSPDTKVFDIGCLQDIISFIKEISEVSK